jgi:hypothetical protein
MKGVFFFHRLKEFRNLKKFASLYGEKKLLEVDNIVKKIPLMKMETHF